MLTTINAVVHIPGEVVAALVVEGAHSDVLPLVTEFRKATVFD